MPSRRTPSAATTAKTARSASTPAPSAAPDAGGSGPASAATPAAPPLKLRQTQAEYVAARPAGEPGVKPMMSSSKMYVCRRCQANFKTGDGKPDARLPGLGKCNKCLAAQAASALAA